MKSDSASVLQMGAQAEAAHNTAIGVLEAGTLQ